MSESHADQVDESKLGEAVGDDELPSADYPTETPLAVDDKSITRDGVIARDDVATREERRSDDDRPRPPAPGLVETTDDPDVVDDERQLLAERVDTESSPEADAVRITDE